MRIGLDFDGVISDCSKLKSYAANLLYGVDIPPAQFKKEIVVDGGLLTKDQYRALQKTIYGTRELGLLMEPVDGVLHYLPRLAAEGHEMLIVTSRGEVELEIAREWTVSKGLALHFVGVGYGNSKANAAAGLDMYVDDDLDKLEPLVRVVPHRYLFSWGYNQHVDVGSVAKRIAAWEELYGIIREVSMKPRYYTVKQMLEMISEPNRAACLRILADHRTLFQTVQGSTHNHQAWPGGYFDHVQETMNIVLAEYNFWHAIRPLPFPVADALLVMFLHDIEKPWKYELGEDGHLQHIESLRSKEAQHEFRARKLAEYGLTLTLEQENAMRYVEGEMNDYSNCRRVMGELAALCHCADVKSARLFYNYPLAHDDPWTGATRFRQPIG